MAALVQTYPQQTGTITMLQTRPASTSGAMSGNQSNPNHQYMGSSQAPRSAYPTGYRGSAAPIQPYAFTGTPNLNQNLQWQPYGTYRTNSSPAIPQSQSYDPNMIYRNQMVNNPAANNFAYAQNFGMSHGGSRDDSVIYSARNTVPAARPQSYIAIGSQPLVNPAAPIKNAPDRYRRPTSQQAAYHGRTQSSTLPVTLSVNNVNQVYAGQLASRASAPNLSNTLYVPGQGVSKDDVNLPRRSSPDEANRTRRRSVHALESSDLAKPVLKAGDATRPASPLGGRGLERDAKTNRTASSPAAHSRKGSTDSVSSSRSNHSRPSSRPSSATNRNVPVSTANPSLLVSDETTVKRDQPKLVNIPARGASSDAAKRTTNPSPLSRPATMATESAEDSLTGSFSGLVGGNVDSPAAKQLAAINQKGGKAKNKTSRLRRAFSFGSAAEFRAAAGPQAEAPIKAEPSKLHKEPSPDEAYNAEQARIAQAQEAAGIGNSIYGGRFFGSTDNLSVSSTASSASIMIRKMGRGMKKSTRSLVGLFRPKSVIGVPAAEALAPEASQAAVSMITVEAETLRVNVTADPLSGNGGTGFPHLERNSIDAARVPEMMAERAGSSGSGTDTSNSNARKSIVGGDRERAEVLAAVRKGILKRTSSPSLRNGDVSPGLTLPAIPNIADSPLSSAPSTPNEENQGHRRTGSVAIGSEDYFMAALRFRQDVKSTPGTPQGSTGKRNATFSPRIIFHDTWPSQEYDRRGEVATCNRLTPMLAQQIKEELNTFKMEMEVHENSKIYTHFF